MKTLIPIFEQEEVDHFTTSDLKTKAEAATIYMLSGNYLSADHLFEDVVYRPSNEKWYQVMVASFVMLLGSFEARALQSYGFRCWSLLIRSRGWWWFYPALFVTDYFVDHPLEIVIARKKYPTWSYYKKINYANDLNENIFKKMLTN